MTARGLFVIGTTLAIAGTLGFCLMGPPGATFVMPGPLSSNHAWIGDDCARCHVGPDGRIKGPTHGLGFDTAAAAESALCQECHDLGAHAMQPHSMDPTRLAAISGPSHTGDAPAAGWGLISGLGYPTSASGEIACATCHREHQGQGHDLRALADASCQVCHSSVWESFDSGHPELGSYPYHRRTGLIFDHVSHRARHFPDHDTEFGCEGCHTPERSGEYMTTGTFESMCDSCHHHRKRLSGAGRSEPGIVVIRLPGVDTYTLEERGFPIGTWPATAEDEYDGVATPFLHLLLAADPEYTTLDRDRALLDDLDPLDLEDASDEELRAIQGYFLAIRRALEREPQDLAGSGEMPRMMARWLASAPVRSAASTWLHEDAGADGSSEAPPRWDTPGTWVRDDDELTLTYLPTPHIDPFLREWLDVTAGSDAPIAAEVFRELAVEDGRCMECHAIEPGDAGRPRIRWRGFRPPAERSFTRFRHAPHLLTTGDEGCESCHQLDPEAKYLESFAPGAALDAFVPEFKPMTRDECAGCHQESSVGASCTLCHPYHVGSPPRPRGS